MPETVEVAVGIDTDGVFFVAMENLFWPGDRNFG